MRGGSSRARRWLAPGVVVLLGLGCGGGAGAPGRPAADPDLVPGPASGLRPADEIASLDLAVDATGVLHALWNAAVEELPGTLPRHATFHSRGRFDAGAGGFAWSEPEGIAEVLAPVRAVATDAALHLVCGPRLRHFVAPAGDGWRDLGELLAEGPPGAVAFDLEVLDGALLVAYLRRPKTPYEPLRRGREHEQELSVLRVAADASSESIPVARFAPTMTRPVAPRLLAVGSTLHLLAGYHEEPRRAEAGRAAAVGERGRVRAFVSRDSGRSWRASGDVLAGPDGFEALRGLELAAAPSGLLALVSAHGVWAARLREGSGWTGARRLNPYEPGAGAGTPLSLSVAATARDGDGRVVWVDQRHRRGDSRWWNPTGGVPWSDDTRLWANNDLFSLHLAEVEAVLGGAPAPAPERLTPDLAYAAEVRTAVLGGQFVALWSGRRRVGKHLRDAGEPPAVFFRSWPAVEAAGEPQPGRREAAPAD